MKVIQTVNKKKDSPLMADYRKITGFTGNKLKEQLLDEYALKRVCIKNNLVESDARRILLHEETLEQAIENSAKANDLVVDAEDTDNEIVRELENCLKLNDIQQRSKDKGKYKSLLLEGGAGVGKTSIVNQWVDKRGMTMVSVNLSNLPVEQLAGVIFRRVDDPNFAARVLSEELYLLLSQPDVVLFLDEYNRAPHIIRRSLMDLVLSHTLPFPAEQEETFKRYGEVVGKGKLWFPTLRMIVAAQNPNTPQYMTNPMDTAERNRFKKVIVTANPISVRSYLLKNIKKEVEDAIRDGDKENELIARGKFALVDKILSNPRFRFESGDESDEEEDALMLSPRSFENAIDDSFGKKDKLIKEWPYYCGSKSLPLIKTILADYKDVEDRANDALKRGTSSEVFGSKKSIWDTIQSKIDTKD